MMHSAVLAGLIQDSFFRRNNRTSESDGPASRDIVKHFVNVHALCPVWGDWRAN
jgi:hypothetical protein